MILLDDVALDELRADLRGDDAARRDRAAAVLARLAPDALVRWPDLGALLKKEEHEPPIRLDQLENTDVLTERIAVLGTAAPDLAPSRAQHVAWLEDERPRVREIAVCALAREPSLEARVLLAIKRRLDDPDPWVREAAVQALARDWPGAWQWREALMARVKDPHHAVRLAAVQALAWHLPGNHAVGEVLVEAFRDQRYAVREAAVRSLARAPDAAWARPLVTLLKDRFDEVVVAALDVLAAMGSL